MLSGSRNRRRRRFISPRHGGRSENDQCVRLPRRPLDPRAYGCWFIGRRARGGQLAVPFQQGGRMVRLWRPSQAKATGFRSLSVRRATQHSAAAATLSVPPINSRASPPEKFEPQWWSANLYFDRLLTGHVISEGSCTSQLQLHTGRPPRSNGVIGDDWITDELSSEDVLRIADTYHAWRDGNAQSVVPVFCKSASLEEIRRHGHVLTLGRYVAAEFQGNDGKWIPPNRPMAKTTV